MKKRPLVREARGRLGAALVSVALFGPPMGTSAQQPPPSAWPYFGGERSFQRYAPLTQIDRNNVGALQVLWRRPAVDPAHTAAFPDDAVPGNLRSTPILVDGVLFAPNALGLVEAFDPGTGETIWRQRPFGGAADAARGRSSRGVDYWRSGTEGRLLSVRDAYLYALDPATGIPFPDFGDGGRVNLIPSTGRSYSWSSGPIVVGDVIVVGGVVDGAGDSGMQWRGSAPENVRGYDVRTGALLWAFHVVPEDGELGVDTWGDDSWMYSGDLGSWCCMSADESLGLVYVPLGAPTAAYYGGHRPGANLFSNSLLALDAKTGERVWHFQMVHHDLWEYDTVGPPTLGDITVNGRLVRAVMQPSKTGFLYVFDRLTGEPVWPIEERAVPQSTVPGERTSPTQPFPTKPAPFAQQAVTVDDLIDFTPDLRRRALALADSFLLGGIFTPPSLVVGRTDGKRGTLSLPGSWGAGNWNTGAFDPETGIYYAFAHAIPRVYRLEEATDPESEMEYWSPGRDAPYLDGLPITKPPWGRITAIDMNTGEHVWSAANGRGPVDHPLLDNPELPDLGVASRPAALVTRTLLFMGDGGNVFGGVQRNMWGKGFRAYDKATGDVIWETELPTGATGAPMSYMHRGKQYIVVPIGGRDEPPEWVALGIPSQERTFVWTDRQVLGTESQLSAGMTFADVDGDGDMDALVANGRHWPQASEVYLNNGSGRFTVSYELGRLRATTYALPAGDLDGDGDIDVVVANDQAENWVYLNDGTGHFEMAWPVGPEVEPTRSAQLFDLDEDGDLDLLITNRGASNGLFLNDGRGRFGPKREFGKADGSTIAVAVGDVDADGDQDLVLANRDGQANQILLNDGRLGFAQELAYGTGSDETRSAALADLNGDGILDIVNVNIGEPNRVYLGDGKGGFDAGTSIGELEESYAVVVVDVDLDGDLDVVVGNDGGRNELYLNDGSGTGWTRSWIGEAADNSYGVAAADLNGDGFPDLGFANSGAPNRIFLNRPSRPNAPR
ncbi:MAG: FG-GAP-like repeat-containing protein [Gemmatimonadetes bacterium]|nr:FG-GAP-like repeat-containing protein [Gemmatimonadota bacterium]